MRRFFLTSVVGLLFSGVAVAADPGSLSEGTYATEGESHYENGEISLVYQGLDTWTMTANLMDEDRLYEVEVYLLPGGSGIYDGSGIITVRYGEDRGCRHRFGVSMKVEDNSIYLRENTPGNIPYNPNGPCTAAGPYVWFNHDEPYVLQDQGR